RSLFDIIKLQFQQDRISERYKVVTKWNESSVNAEFPWGSGAKCARNDRTACQMMHSAPFV
ncbi:MAG: hypothetical protein II504_00065, partial [Clostridia bacterium]|nr:hypothetical protein [Clostridia bacterium]